MGYTETLLDKQNTVVGFHCSFSLELWLWPHLVLELKVYTIIVGLQWSLVTPPEVRWSQPALHSSGLHSLKGRRDDLVD